MDITLDSMTLELLDVLKENQIQLWIQNGRKDIADIWDKFEYNDLVKVLHLGFSEKAFYDTISGILEVTEFNIPKEQMNKVRQGLHTIAMGK